MSSKANSTGSSFVKFIILFVFIAGAILGIIYFAFPTHFDKGKDDKTDTNTSTTTAISDKVTDLKITATTSTTLTVGWQLAKDATSYAMQIKQSNENEYTTPFNAVASPYTFTNLLPGTSYSIQILALVNGFQQEPITLSPNATTWTVPGEVSNVSHSSTINNITLSFDVAPNASTYTLKIKPSVTSNWQTYSTTIQASNSKVQTTVNNLVANTSYDFQIIPMDVNGQNGQLTEIDNVFTLPSNSGGNGSAPGLVQNLQTTQKLQTHFSLSWNAPIDGTTTSYTVSWIDVASTTGISQSQTFAGPINSQDLVTFTATNCSPGVTYRVTVVAINSNSSGLGTSIDVLLPSVPADVINLAASTPIGLNTIPLTWSILSTERNNITFFNVKYRINGTTSWIGWSGNPITVNSTTNMNTTFTTTLNDLTASTTYDIQIIANNTFGSSLGTGSGCIISSISTVTPAGAPTNVTVTTTSINSVNMSWTPPSNSNNLSYNYKYVKTNTSDTPQTGSTSSTSMSFNNLSSNVLYDFQVQSFSTSTNTPGAWSSITTFKVGVPAAVVNFQDLCGSYWNCSTNETTVDNRWIWGVTPAATHYTLYVNGHQIYTGTAHEYIANPVIIDYGSYTSRLVASNQYGSTETQTTNFLISNDCY